MKVTKFGHCCLLIEVDRKRILTDPGRFSVSQNLVEQIDLILISHEHTDHLHSESLLEVIKNNPKVKVVTNASVGKILSNLGVVFEILEGNTTTEVAGILVETYDGKHVEIFKEYGQVQNTGYFIAEQLFYPGDSYIEPGKEVPILALPVSGPWCKASEAISYVLRIKPGKAFPVHDGLLNQNGVQLTHGLFKSQLATSDVEFIPLTNGESIEF